MSEPHDHTLHDLAPTERFSERASDYARFRPDYPPAAIDAVLEGLGDPARLVAADVGAGTGISARLLADRGTRVWAVEPNAEMRAAAAPHPLLMWREGTGEATGLDSAAVDLVLCAQSFHWIRVAEAAAEFHRVLRPGGRVALVWNRRDRADPLTRGYVEAIRAVHGEDPADRHAFEPRVFDEQGRFDPLEPVAFSHAQTLDRDGLLGRAISASYVPKSGPQFEQLGVLLGELFDRHRDAADRVTLRYRTEVWRATRRS